MTLTYRHGFLANVQATVFSLYAWTLILPVTNCSGQEQIDSAALNRYTNQWREVERRKVSPKLALTPNTANSVASSYSSSSTRQTDSKVTLTTTISSVGE